MFEEGDRLPEKIGTLLGAIIVLAVFALLIWTAARSFVRTQMTGYEQSPDYGDPPSGRGSTLAALVAVIAIALMFVVDA